MVKWDSHTSYGERTSKYDHLFSEIQRGQAEHPNMWAEVTRFTSVSAARSLSVRARKRYGKHGFEVKSAVDRVTGEGIVQARYIGS